MSNSNEINFTIRKKHLTIAVIVIATASLIVPYQISAQNQLKQASQEVEEVLPPAVPEMAQAPSAALSNVFVMPSSSIRAGTVYMAVGFTTADVPPPAMKRIDITFPSGFDISNTKLIEKSDNLGSGSIAVAGQTVSYVLAMAQSLPSGTQITLLIGRVTEPSPAPAGFSVAVTTRDASDNIIDGPTTSPAVPLSLVTASMIGPKAVKTAGIDDNAITSAKIASDAIGARELRDVVYQVQSADVFTSAGNVGTATAACNAGDKVLGGGHNTGANDILVGLSVPDTDSSWTVRLKPTSVDILWAAFAVCLDITE